jgi:hypothetical protein
LANAGNLWRITDCYFDVYDIWHIGQMWDVFIGLILNF